MASNESKALFGHSMMLDTRHRGILLVAFGFFFAVAFLVGGGVITSSNGGYWTTMFVLGFVLGLACAGPFIYRSAKSCGGKTTCGRSMNRESKTSRLIGVVVIGLTASLSQAFFRSDLFSSNLVQHIFMICMGLSLSLFVPLGLGFLYALDEQALAPEPTAGSVSNDKSLPPAQ